jgi:hypothetical protein
MHLQVISALHAPREPVIPHAMLPSAHIALFAVLQKFRTRSELSGHEADLSAGTELALMTHSRPSGLPGRGEISALQQNAAAGSVW